MRPPDPPPAADLAALRRRLYAPDATDEDRAAYLAAAAAVSRPAEPRPGVGGALEDSADAGADADADAAPAPEAEPAAAAARPARARGRAILAGVLTVAAVVVAAVAFTAGPGRSVPTPTPAVVPPGTPLAVPASARDGFVRALSAGGEAGLADYLFHHPEARPAPITTLTRAATEEHSGTGGATISLGPTDLAEDGGHLTVILTTGGTADGTWLAARITVDRVQRVALRTGTFPAGTPMSTTVAYTGRAATLLSVSLPRGTRWDALVVFSN